MKLPVLMATLALSSPAQSAFDAASVRVHKAGVDEGGGPWIQTSPGAVTIRNAKLLWCLAWAYTTKDWLVSGPDWIDSERYDIIAKTPEPVPAAQLRVMLQTLLADRFKLVLHRENKEFPVTMLVVAKGGPRNLQEAAAPGPPEGPLPVGGKAPVSLLYKSVSLADFADRLGAPPPLGIGERVVDGTGLSGPFDIALKINSADFVGGHDDFAGYMKALVEDQLGIKMESRKVPFDTLVVDRGNKLPVGN